MEERGLRPAGAPRENPDGNPQGRCARGAAVIDLLGGKEVRS